MKRKILKLSKGLLVEEDEVVRLKEKPKLKEDSKKTVQLLSTIGGIGFQIAFPLIIGVAAGKYFDSRFSSYPKFTLMLLGVGFFVSISALVNLIRTINKE